MSKTFALFIAIALILTTPVASFATTDIPTFDDIEQTYSTSFTEILFATRDTVTRLKGLLDSGEITERNLQVCAMQVEQLNKALIDVDYLLNESEKDTILNIILQAKTLKPEGSTNEIHKQLDRALLLLQANMTNNKFRISLKVEEPVAVTPAPTTTPQTQGVVTLTPATSGVKTFKDITNHWAKANIEALASRGAINGINATDFNPQGTVTYSQYLKIAYCAVKGELPATPAGVHWASNVFNAALKDGVINEGEITRDMWDKPIPRADMAFILIRVNEKLMKEQEVSTLDAVRVMGDYAEVAKNVKTEYYVSQAYMKGMITGVDSKGTFAGTRTGTRAEAATMVIRMLEKDKRVAVKTPEAPTAGTTARVIDSRDTKRDYTMPKPGDTFIKKDGTKVVLKVGPSGILGEGQGCDLYGGIVGPNGHVFVEGDTMEAEMGFLGETYLICKITGEGHSSSEWREIRDYWTTEAGRLYPGTEAKAGQQVGIWVVRSGGMWTWRGPVNLN